MATTVDVAEGTPTMNFIDQLDPELRAVVQKLPPDRPLDLNEIPAARTKMKKMMTAALASLTGSPIVHDYGHNRRPVLGNGVGQTPRAGV